MIGTEYLGTKGLLQKLGLRLGIPTTAKVDVEREADYHNAMQKHLSEELPFLATENILMVCVKEKNGDRQLLHERLRLHAIAAAEQVKVYGRDNDRLQRIAEDPAFDLTAEELEALAHPSAFTGMAGCYRQIFEGGRAVIWDR